jgi:hypothetical protein
MNSSIIWQRILIVAGLAGMLVGAIDPLEGCFIILPSFGLVGFGALIGKSRHVALLGWGFALVAFGVTAMIVTTWLGGVGGNSVHSKWWLLAELPYPIGWIMGLVGAIRSLIDSRQFRASQSGTR